MERRLNARDGKVWLDGWLIAEFLRSEYDSSKDLEDWMNDMLVVAYHPLTRYLAGVENEMYHGKPERQGKEVFKWLNSYNSSSRELPIEIKKVRSSKNLPSVKDCVLLWYQLFIWRNEFRFVDNVNEVILEICQMHRSAFETKPEDADTDEDSWEYEDGANPPKFSCPSSLFLPEIDGGYVYFKYYRDYPILKVLDEKAVKKVFDECAPVPAFGVLDVAWSSEWMKLMQYVEDANTRKNKICYKMAKKTKKFNYLVTDPCYLISHEIWSEVCENTKGKANEEFAIELEKHLPKGSMVHTTGVGDYINSISPVYEDTTVNVVQSCFTVDSGFLCITPVTDTADYEVDTRFAIIESDEELSYGFDTAHPDWTVAEFSHGEKEVIQSEPYDMD